MRWGPLHGYLPISALQGCSLPLPLRPQRGWGGSEEEHLPQLVVKSVYSIVPVVPDQEPGCLHLPATVGLRLRGSPMVLFLFG